VWERTKKMKDFEIITKIKKGGRLTFMTRARNGRTALRHLLDNSYDFNGILTEEDYDNMTIKIRGNGK